MEPAANRIEGQRRLSAQVMGAHTHERPFGIPAIVREVSNAIGATDHDHKTLSEDHSPPVSRLPTFSRTTMRNKALALAGESFDYIAALTKPEVVKELGTDVVKGLTEEEAKKRLEECGPNELEKEPPPSFLRLLLDQFSDLLVLMLVAAAITAAALGEIAASVVIVIIVIANAALGVIQESRAGAALDALESLAAPRCAVLRDGKRVELESRELVPGDVVLVDLGMKIAADMRLLTATDLRVNEMALTGESEPVRKDPEWLAESTASDEVKQPNAVNAHGEKALTERNMLFMGCAVQEGYGKAVVVKTGMSTKMGEISALLASAEVGESPLQIKLHKLGVRLGIASLSASIIVFIIGVSTNRGVDEERSQPAWLQMLLVAVSLTVAAVPEGLPAAVTITLAIGMRRMVKKNALIRNLHSVETLGSANVICTDKTGTLTKGEMTAVRLWVNGLVWRFTGSGYDPQGELQPLSDGARGVRAPGRTVLMAGLVASHADVQYDAEAKRWTAVGSATERPVAVAAAKVGLKRSAVEQQFRVVKENAFNSARKMVSVAASLAPNTGGAELPAYFAQGQNFGIVVGAPNIVLDRSVRMLESEDSGAAVDLDAARRSAVLAAVDEFSGQAFRVLAVAAKPLGEIGSAEPEALESELTLLGMLASIDPERVEVAPSIRKAANAGIRTVMITGDYVKTAKAIAENIQLLPRASPENKAVDCGELRAIATRMAQLEESISAKGQPREQLQALTRELEELTSRLDAITAVADVFARAQPVDKITIVRSLQRQGMVCSMTGDGVNDAPALKQANIGVAMGVTGTDVAKAAADMVLTDDNFCSIVDAIEEGRTIYANISKFVFYLLSTNTAEVFTILLATAFFGLPAPLVPIQILWLNLVTDGAPAVALAVEQIEPGTMQEGPRPKNEPLLDRLMITGICIQATTLTFVVLFTFAFGLHWETGSWSGKFPGQSDDDHEHAVKVARTMTILVITFAELARAYTCRSMRTSIFTLGVFSNTWMQYAVGTSVSCTLIVALVPGIQDVFGMTHITGEQWTWILGIACVPVTVDEITKFVYRRTGYGLRPKIVSVSNDDAGGIHMIEIHSDKPRLNVDATLRTATVAPSSASSLRAPAEPSDAALTAP